MIYFPRTNKTSPYESGKDLNTLANELETDKGTADSSTLSWGPTHPTHHCWGYTNTYEKYMSKFREENVKFLEIGICDHRFPYASPKMWLKYFKNLDLYCVDNFWGRDIGQETNSISIINDLGVNFIYADQYSKPDWDEIDEIVGENSLDFLVEDGSHYPHHMLYTLWRAIKLVKPGGYYFMEDVQTEASRNFWGYDNADITISLINAINGQEFNSSYIEKDKLEEINLNFELVDLVVDKNGLNYLGVFRKK